MTEWFVNRLNSALMGDLLKGVNVPSIHHPLSVERHWKIWSEIVFISICHQANWDRLHERIIEVASDHIEDLYPVNLCNLESKLFDRIFAPGLDADRIRRSERIKLLRDLGRRAIDWPNGSEKLWLENESIKLSGYGGVYNWLDSIPLFAEDPVKKKSRVLIHQLLKYNLISVLDSENILPAIDYHLIRFYIRTARVSPVNDAWGQRLKEGAKVRVEPITALRYAVEEAMHYTANAAGLRIDELNHIEWQISRSFCVRNNPRCFSNHLAEKPIDLAVAKLSCISGGCPMVRICPAVYNSELREMLDPRSSKSYY